MRWPPGDEEDWDDDAPLHVVAAETFEYYKQTLSVGIILVYIVLKLAKEQGKEAEDGDPDQRQPL